MSRYIATKKTGKPCISCYNVVFILKYIHSKNKVIIYDVLDNILEFSDNKNCT